MKFRSICLVASLSAASLSAQEVIRLYTGAAPGSEDANYPEKQYFSKAWNTEVVTNVTQPNRALPRTVSASSASPRAEPWQQAPGLGTRPKAVPRLSHPSTPPRPR